MEKNKLSLQLSRIAITITLVIWVLALTIFILYLDILFPIFLIYLIPTILNIKISYKKHYEDNNSLPLILITLFLYISFGAILIPLFPDYIRIVCVFFVPQTIFLILACLALKKYNKMSNIVKRINESSFKLKNNTLPLFLTRISLVITLPYIGWLVTIFESSSLNSSIENGMDMTWLPFHLAAVVTSTVFNIFISLKQIINESMIMTIITIYVISGMLGELFFPSTVIISIIQVMLLVFALSTFKNNNNN